MPRSTMECLCQAIMGLALIVPALAAPGPMPTGPQQPMTKAWAPLKGRQINTPAVDVAQSAVQHTPVLSAQASTMSSPTELRKRKDSKKSDNIPCTPGDRYCHASLDHVLFCNDAQNWVTYAQCPSGTFCHRLHLICVPERAPKVLEPFSHTPRAVDDSYNQCKEGDRRCSATFNRVDRCNSSHEWVTYHDCRKSELCDQKVLECLPLGEVGVDQLQPPPTHTATATATPMADYEGNQFKPPATGTATATATPVTDNQFKPPATGTATATATPMADYEDNQFQPPSDHSPTATATPVTGNQFQPPGGHTSTATATATPMKG